MTTPDRSTLTHFDHWLDALVSGMPAPETDTASDSTTDPAMSRDARFAAPQFHDLMARTDRTTPGVATTERLDTIWEDILDAHLTQPVTVSGNTAPGAHRPSRTGERPIAAGDQAPIWLGRLQPVVNATLAAALILALVTGVWRTVGGFDLGFGDGGNGSPAQLAGLVNQDAPPATPDPSAVGGKVILPTADECTVEPLTIDDVIEILKDPQGTYVKNQTAGAATPMAPEATAEAERRANAIALDETRGPVPQEIMDEVTATQRHWVACVMKGAYFQKWALEYPGTVHGEITRLLPLFTSEDETRALLMDLERTGSIDGLPPLSERYADGRVVLVNPDPSTAHYSVSSDGTWAVVFTGWIRYDVQGNPGESHPYTDDPNSAYVPWSFTLLGDRGPWLIATAGGFQG